MKKQSPFEKRRQEELLWEAIPDDDLLIASPDNVDIHGLPRIAQSICVQYKVTATTRCRAEFHPYVGLTSTIRIVKGETRIRISDILEGAPAAVLESLIRLLIAQAVGDRPCQIDVHEYQRYIQSPEIEVLHNRTRMARGRKTLIGPTGRFYHLDDSFKRVNRVYFTPTLHSPTLSWSPTPSRRRLGYHDEARDLIVISRWLDRKTVPQYVLDYIMYHEMLHIAVPPVKRGSRRIVHSKSFLERERLFQEYDLATRWLDRYATR